MDSSVIKDRLRKKKRSFRVRNKVRGSKERPRLCVVKTNKHIYVQLIDDEQGKTLGAVSTLSKELGKIKKNKETAHILGKKIAELGQKLNINTIVFDRGPFKYHGIVEMVAIGARETGLMF